VALRPLWLSAIAVFFLSGCKTTPLDQARTKFYAGKYLEAQRILAKAKPKTKDRLLYLVEEGLILHTAGEYEESNAILLEAAKLSEGLETISASRSAASLVTNDRTKHYRGERFERVLIHTYLTINFLMLEDYEKALVEAKRALKKLEDAKDPAEQHPFTRYVAAVCFELLKDYEDAYLEYQRVQKHGPQYQAIKNDLVRVARTLGRKEDEQKWLALPGPAYRPQAGKSEVILFVQTGKGPKKVSSETIALPSHRFALPVYVTRYSKVEGTAIRIGEREAGPSHRLLDINLVASHDLDKRSKKATLKETLRKGGQEVIAHQTDNLLAQVAVRAAFFAMSKADDRCWQTLPRDLRIARVPIAPGKYDIQVKMLDYSGTAFETFDFEGLTVPPSRPAILSVRSVQ